MNAERRLRRRIRRILSLAGFDQTQASYALRDVEDLIMRLFQEYSHASERRKDEVYARGEQRILEAILSSQRAQTGGATATG